MIGCRELESKLELDLSATQKLVLIVLLHHVECDGGNVSIETLARETSLSRSSIIRAIKVLKERRLIDITDAARKSKPARYDTIRESDRKERRERNEAVRTNNAPATPYEKVYRENIGELTPKIINEIKEIENTYSFAWFDEAVTIACIANQRKLSYIKAVLLNWRRHGKNNSRAKGEQERNEKHSLAGLKFDNVI